MSVFPGKSRITSYRVRAEPDCGGGSWWLHGHQVSVQRDCSGAAMVSLIDDYRAAGAQLAWLKELFNSRPHDRQGPRAQHECAQIAGGADSLYFTASRAGSAADRQICSRFGDYLHCYETVTDARGNCIARAMSEVAGRMQYRPCCGFALRKRAVAGVCCWAGNPAATQGQVVILGGALVGG